MTIKVIKKIENGFKTEKRPSGYPTFLVKCSGCWKEYPMIKYEIKKRKYCYDCANKRREWITIWKDKCEHKWWKWGFNKKHWMKWTHFYKKRTAMVWRCKYPCVNWYKNYWGRGIKCLWNSFEDFKNDMYESYLEFFKEHWEDTTLDRIDTNWDYYKENCRWLTMKEQQATKRCNLKPVYKWVQYPSLKWLCELVDKDYHTVHARIKRGWSIEDSIDKPV